MALQTRSPANHNQMLGRFIKHPKSTNFDDDGSPPAKRQRIQRLDTDDTSEESTAPPSPKLGPQDRNDDGSGEDKEDKSLKVQHQTDLESALPPIKTDEEAIKEYQAFKSAEGKREWIRGKSSIYVDAFNLALETVLDEESDLFDEAEMTVFKRWRDLNYEAQYL
jgi:Fanconi-associated nuclease 1